VIFGVSHEPISAIAGCLRADASGKVVLTKVYVSAQVALPDWARGRGLAIFLTGVDAGAEGVDALVVEEVAIGGQAFVGIGFHRSRCS
jgi:Transmembrane secretion effector